IRNAKALRLRKGNARVTYISTGKNSEKDKSEWTPDEPIEGSCADIDTSSFLSQDLLSSLQRLDISSGTGQGNDLYMRSELPKDIPMTHIARVRSNSGFEAAKINTVITT